MKSLKWNEDNVEIEIKKCMDILNIYHMPTRSELESILRIDLVTGIGRNGGFEYFRNKLNLPKKVIASKYDDSIIKEKILEVINALNLDRMPSRSEIEEYFGDNAVSGKITKTKLGYYGFAEELGLEIKDSETYFGKTHEFIVYDKLKSNGYDVIKMPQNFPYDLLVNKSIKVDVKVSNLYEGKNGNFYSYSIDKPFICSDIYVLLTLDNNGDIDKEYIVPSNFVYNNTQISIGQYKSKYDKFISKWDYIDKFDNFYKSLV